MGGKRTLYQEGLQFENLTVVRGGYRSANGSAGYLCTCSCGKRLVVTTTNLNRGQTSCGCDKSNYRGKPSHGMTGTKTYRIWDGMIQRCTNPNSGSYKYYGAKGITVCDSWKLFENFLADMGECPDGYQIDRRLSKEGYYRDNCRWVTQQVNLLNQHETSKGNLAVAFSGLTESQFDKLIASIGRDIE